MPSERVELGHEGVGRAVDDLAARLEAALAEVSDVAVVGVRRGGVALAARLARRLGARRRVDLGTVDIALYRDDAHRGLPKPFAGPTELPFDVEGRHVVLVDDVFWTGRTARAAMDAVLDFGRPRRLWLVTLATRPGRELPVTPDLSVLALSPAPGERIELRLAEDGHASDALVVVEKGAR
jgi:pyrimidine operon attenuation protein/uracil phosphoribosyltransferase